MGQNEQKRKKSIDNLKNRQKQVDLFRLKKHGVPTMGEGHKFFGKERFFEKRFNRKRKAVLRLLCRRR